jgi:hypothetical protein
VGHQDYFLAPLPGSIALFVSSLGIYIVCCITFIMGKPRDGKFSILPSTTRRGTTLNTSVALDSPSVMSKLLTPPHAYATSSTEFENATDSFDDASTVLDESGLLGSFLDATIARTKQLENTTVTPASSPESRECPSDDLDDAYIELDDNLFMNLMLLVMLMLLEIFLQDVLLDTSYLLMLSLLLLP